MRVNPPPHKFPTLSRAALTHAEVLHSGIPSLGHARVRAFSLPELLVVLGLVILLLGITIPVLASVRHRSADAVTLNNIRQIGLAVADYADTHRDVVPAIFKPVYTFGDAQRQSITTPHGIIEGHWFRNDAHYRFILPEPLPGEVLIDPRNPNGVGPWGTESNHSDFIIAHAFFASPAYWDRYNQKGPEQWAAQQLNAVAYPSAKGFVSQITVYDVPGFADGFMTCCVDEVPSAVLWSDLSASTEIQARLNPGVPNNWFHEGASLPVWADGRPIDNTERGILGRDR